MPPAKRPWWQQATALVSLSAGGAVTGFHFAPKPAGDLNSPSNIQVRLLALARAAQPASSGDGALRSAIVNVAQYYLRMAQHKTPAEMEALIWQHDSIDGTDHGESCAAFASLTLELAAQVVGRESWVSGGSTYPWPLHDWADVRVDTNTASPGIISVLQDAQAHHRWHPLGDGYRARPGDWVLFRQHVEVVTGDANGVLHTIGGDSLPDMSVNAHTYDGSLADHGVAGFVNNGDLPAVAGARPRHALPSGGHHETAGQPGSGRSGGGKAGRSGGGSAGKSGSETDKRTSQPDTGRANADQANAGADVPGAGLAGPATAFLAAPATASPQPGSPQHPSPQHPSAAHPSPQHPSPQHPSAEHPSPTHADPAVPGTGLYTRHHPARGGAAGGSASAGSSAEQVFIREVAPGAMATQRRYGVPASVTIAQAIDESGWGSSALAVRDHNLFGIKGTGPDGSDAEPTQEYVNGHAVSITAKFRVYGDVAQSIEDHGRLLATSGYYTRAMADRQDPNEFAVALTGVYATDPDYGAKLIGLMRRYDLYRYNIAALATPASPDASASPAPSPATPSPATPTPAIPGTATPAGTATPSPAIPASSAAPAGTTPTQAASRPSNQVTVPGTPASPAPTSPDGNSSPHAAPGTPGAAVADAAGASIPGVSGGVSGSPGAVTGGISAAEVAGGSVGGAAIPGAGMAPAGTVPRARSAPAARTAAVPGVRTTAVYRAPASAAHGTPSGGRADATGATRMNSAGSATGTAAGAQTAPAARPAARDSAGRSSAGRGSAARPAARTTGPRGYRSRVPLSVQSAFNTLAKMPLLRMEPLYRDVASYRGVSWELLAACDWMQCEARARYSAVNGEKLGTPNRDGTVYRTRSEALEQCADDLVELSWAVYHLDLTSQQPLSVRELAEAFAAFRWGGLLKLHRTSAMEFPYSVAGLTDQHVGMRWPDIADPNAPDKPGSRFRKPFGAIPIVLGLRYRATA